MFIPSRLALAEEDVPRARGENWREDNERSYLARPSLLHAAVFG
jgi:hypothetical protein